MHLVDVRFFAIPVCSNAGIRPVPALPDTSLMPALKILCTRKTRTPEIHLAISHVGGVNSSKLPWTLSVHDAIRTLELKQYAFYVMLDTRRTDVFVAQTKTGHKYLKCTADIIGGDTLSALADCP